MRHSTCIAAAHQSKRGATRGLSLRGEIEQSLQAQEHSLAAAARDATLTPSTRHTRAEQATTMMSPPASPKKPSKR